MPEKLPTTANPALRLDPRLYQIAMLASLLAYGMVRLDFEIAPGRAAVMLVVALLTQYACTRFWKLPAFDPRSALISGLSLCLLLRTNSIALAIAAGVITIASKFVVRIRGKHLFNPTNFGIVAMMLLTGQVWVSPGQWGNVTIVADNPWPPFRRCSASLHDGAHPGAGVRRSRCIRGVSPCRSAAGYWENTLVQLSIATS